MKYYSAMQYLFGAEYLKSSITGRGHDVNTIFVRGPSGKMKRFLRKMRVGKETARFACMATYTDERAETLKVNGINGPLESGYRKNSNHSFLMHFRRQQGMDIRLCHASVAVALSISF